MLLLCLVSTMTTLKQLNSLQKKWLIYVFSKIKVSFFRNSSCSTGRCGTKSAPFVARCSTTKGIPPSTGKLSGWAKRSTSTADPGTKMAFFYFYEYFWRELLRFENVSFFRKFGGRKIYIVFC